jgi:hypothetical protein
LRVEPACKRRVRGEDEEGVNISEVLHMHAWKWNNETNLNCFKRAEGR